MFLGKPTLKSTTPAKRSENEIVIRGIVERVTFHNPDNGYAVLQLRVENQAEQITVVGNIIDVKAGANLMVRGTYQNHDKFGKQLSAHSITPSIPSSELGIEKYLASGLIKGIGPKTAKKLIQKFGEKTIEVIINHPERIATIRGISKSKAESISMAMAEQQEVHEIMRFLVEHNITTGLAARLYSELGNRTIEIVSKDPYVLARTIKGIGFATADSIALNLGMELGSPQRLKAGLYYALEKARDEGHCFLPHHLLIKRAGALLGVDVNDELFDQLDNLIAEDFLVRDNDDIYIKHLYNAEEAVATFIVSRCVLADQKQELISIPKSGILKQAEKSLGISFSFEQEMAVAYALSYPLLVITGGPGCGKTTVIKALVAMFQDGRKTIALAAPTGRAAQRMAQVTDMPAKTIHRLLSFEPTNRTFLYNISNPIKLEGKEVDVVIIDEASMIDLQLAKDLFSAIPRKATVILVGDKDQLPSVGPGRVFADLVSIKEIKIISLSQLFRRKKHSEINEIAHNINAGIIPRIPEPDGSTKSDAYFIPRKNADDAVTLIEKLVSDQIPKKFGIPFEQIYVLTPTNRGPLGTSSLNSRIQECLNPKSESKAEIMINDICFRVGDRVCQRVNNYQIDSIGVFNGDIGIMYSIDTENRTAVVELWDGRLIKYEKSNLGQLSLSYAMTIHRSQGSEIPCVVMALHESHFTLLERQLIYTGVTRAKKLLIIVGSYKALAMAAKRTNAQKRYSRLRERVKNSLDLKKRKDFTVNEYPQA